MRKYDDFDFHARAAEESGQDSENGFTHIGFFLSWMLRRGLGDPSVFGSQVAGELRSGRMRANDLRDLVDGQLLSSMATTIGSEFLDAYYLGGYSADFDAEFSSSAPYSVTDDPDYQTRIDRRLDSAFESWVAAGQPSSDSPTALWHTAPPPTDIAAAAAQAAAELAGTVTVSPISDAPQAHRDPVLETRVARAISVSSPVHSYTVRDWDSSTLNRALKSLGISTKDATVAYWREPAHSTATAEVCQVPGAGSDDLSRELGAYFEHRIRARWSNTSIDGRSVRIGLGKLPPHPEPWVTAWCSLDGFAMCASSYDREDTKRMLTGLIRELGA